MMAPDAVVTPLSGENLVPQGNCVRVMETQQQEQPHEAAIKPIKRCINELLKIWIMRMKQLEQVADLMLQHIVLGV